MRLAMTNEVKDDAGEQVMPDHVVNRIGIDELRHDMRHVLTVSPGNCTIRPIEHRQSFDANERRFGHVQIQPDSSIAVPPTGCNRHETSGTRLLDCVTVGSLASHVTGIESSFSRLDVDIHQAFSLPTYPVRHWLTGLGAKRSYGVLFLLIKLTAGCAPYAYTWQNALTREDFRTVRIRTGVPP